MHRTAMRAVSTLGAIALALASPTVLGAAAADTQPDAGRTVSGAVVTTALAEAIQQARADFRTAALQARLALRTTQDGVRTAVLTDAERMVVRSGGVVSLRDALAAARTAHQGEIDTAVAAARSALLTARSLYTSTVAAAVARLQPGLVPPRAMLEPGWWPGLTDSAWLATER